MGFCMVACHVYNQLPHSHWNAPPRGLVPLNFLLVVGFIYYLTVSSVKPVFFLLLLFWGIFPLTWFNCGVTAFDSHQLGLVEFVVPYVYVRIVVYLL